jgi:hypothetical protein
MTRRGRGKSWEQETKLTLGRRRVNGVLSKVRCSVEEIRESEEVSNCRRIAASTVGRMALALRCAR